MQTIIFSSDHIIRYLDVLILSASRYFKAGFNHLPQQRRLHGEERAEAKIMLDLKVNKKLLQGHLTKKSGQVILLKDLHNIASSSRSANTNGIEKVVEELNKTPGEQIVYIQLMADTGGGGGMGSLWPPPPPPPFGPYMDQ